MACPRAALFDPVEEPVVLDRSSTAGLIQPVLPSTADQLHHRAEEGAGDHDHQDNEAVDVGPLTRIEDVEVSHWEPQGRSGVSMALGSAGANPQLRPWEATLPGSTAIFAAYLAFGLTFSAHALR